LHVNCSNCHRNGAGGGIASQFNIELTLAQMRALEVKPSRGGFGLAGARVIAPGLPSSSALFFRINTEGGGRMPHIGSRLADDVGVHLLGDWIRSLPPAANPARDTVAARHLAEEQAAWIKAWRNGTGPVAQTRLLSTASGALALLEAATQPGVPGTLRDATAATAASSPDAIVRELWQRLLPPGRRRQTLGTDINPRTILSLKGDAGRGRMLFQQEGGAQCARCHRVRGEGRDFGPDLTLIARKYDRAGVLDQILFPSKIIAPEFKTYTLTLRDGTEISGFLSRTNSAGVLFKGEDLLVRHLTPAEAAEAHPSAISAMPEGLLAPLTAQEAADLLEYLVPPAK
jgi:putative heme-binding domain-containing protein